MARKKTDLTIEQGTTYAHGWAVMFNGDPIDETWTVRGQIRSQAASGAVLLDLAPSINADGTVVIAIDPAESSAFTWRRAVYDIEVVSPDESVTLRIAKGHIIIDPEVTR